MAELLLASGSPRRCDLLSLLGIPFEVVVPHVEEDAGSGGDAREIALRLARMKVEAVAKIRKEKVVVAADTVVALRGQVMGKPPDAVAALDMLCDLRGQEHRVVSGLATLDPITQDTTIQAVETKVRMRDYADEEIADYIARGEPFDKAGGYAIQDQIFRPVDTIQGCYANVMGLPLCHLYLRLQAAGLPPPISPVRACEVYRDRQCLIAAQILKQNNH